MTSSRKAEAARPCPLNKAFPRRATEACVVLACDCFARVQVAVRGGGAADHEVGGKAALLQILGGEGALVRGGRREHGGP